MKTGNFSRIAVAAAALVLFVAVGFTNAQSQSKGLKANTGNHGSLFIDANGDGICDNYANRPQDGTGNKYGAGKKNGSGNGTGICNGTGSGNGSGTGVCDGTGPKGNGKKGK